MLKSKEFSEEEVINVWSMKAKHKSVSEIASALKGSKLGIHRVLTRVKDFKRKFKPELFPRNNFG